MSMLSAIPRKLLQLLRQPGRKPEIKGLAPTQIVVGKDVGTHDEEQAVSGFVEPVKQRRLDRWLDRVVRFSGSEFAFFSILAALLAWALLGIKFGKDENWQVIISDVQAILCYIYDSFLTRQQLNAYTDDMAVITQLQSRSTSCLRMLRQLRDERLVDVEGKARQAGTLSVTVTDHLTHELPAENRFGRFITFVAMALGHVATLSLFWVGIFVWIGIGHFFHYSDAWQLYMNSATSALMVFTFALLANVRERHAIHTKQSLDLLLKADSALELQLRTATRDTQANQEVVLKAPSIDKFQRAIFYYADFVGTLVGIIILVSVITAWIAIGPALKFSSNWWLLIGTYAGLIGMFDGFVLRNMQAALRSYTDAELQNVHAGDELACERAGVPFLVSNTGDERISITTRLSNVIEHLTSHRFAVVAALATVIGLLAGSSAMKWSLTGQLLSNVPPSIIESWLMLVLMTGHNSIEYKQRAELQILYKRRLSLLSSLEHAGKRKQLAFDKRAGETFKKLNKCAVSVEPEPIDYQKLLFYFPVYK